MVGVGWAVLFAGITVSGEDAYSSGVTIAFTTENTEATERTKERKRFQAFSVLSVFSVVKTIGIKHFKITEVEQALESGTSVGVISSVRI
jgi:hypothetical protein